MPRLSDAIGQDLSAYTEVEKSSPQAALPPSQGQEPVLNSMIRCPLPPIYQVSPDNLRQFYQGGQVPQTRILAPFIQNGNSGNTTINETNVSGSSGGGGGGGSSVIIKPPTAQIVSITSGLVGPQETFTGILSVAKSFQLLSLSTSSPARVQLYGTSLASIGDGYRGLDVPPPAGTVQNIVCDVVLDTTPFRWFFQDRVGSNADSPQATTIYVRLTNLDTTSDLITMSLGFVPMES